MEYEVKEFYKWKEDAIDYYFNIIETMHNAVSSSQGTCEGFSNEEALKESIMGYFNQLETKFKNYYIDDVQLKRKEALTDFILSTFSFANIVLTGLTEDELEEKIITLDSLLMMNSTSFFTTELYRELFVIKKVYNEEIDETTGVTISVPTELGEVSFLVDTFLESSFSKLLNEIEGLVDTEVSSIESYLKVRAKEIKSSMIKIIFSSSSDSSLTKPINEILIKDYNIFKVLTFFDISFDGIEWDEEWGENMFLTYRQESDLYDAQII